MRGLYHPREVFETAAEADVFAADGPCPVLVEPGANERAWVITGENGGGKSLLCRAVEGHVADAQEEDGRPVEIMRVGMDLRTEGGFARSMVFGSESTGSTGANSAGAVLAGLETARKRAGPHWLILDEPDVGLDEGYRAGMGELLAGFMASMPAMTKCLAVVTHSREIAGRLVAAGASGVRVGNDLRPVRQWLREGGRARSPEDLEALARTSAERMRAVAAAIGQARRESQDAPGRP